MTRVGDGRRALCCPHSFLSCVHIESRVRGSGLLGRLLLLLLPLPLPLLPPLLQAARVEVPAHVNSPCCCFAAAAAALAEPAADRAALSVRPAPLQERGSPGSRGGERATSSDDERREERGSGARRLAFFAFPALMLCPHVES